MHQSYRPNGGVCTGGWNHVAVTVQRLNGNSQPLTSGGKIFLNGQVIHNFNPKDRASNLDNGDPLWIGRSHVNPCGATSFFWNGGIDEVEIFKRELAPSEIMDIFLADKAGKCKSSPIIGACCDTLNGVCSEGILEADCVGDQRTWTDGASCAEVVCDPAPGACCDQDVFGTCTVTTAMACDCLKCVWHKLLACEDIECKHNSIPTVSQWGLVVLTLLLLTGAKVYFGRRQTETA